MCVWNYGVFDNDTALDLEEDLKDNPIAFFTDAFNTALATDFLDQDEACAVLVSAAYIDHYLNHTDYYEDTIKNNVVAKKAHTFKALKPSNAVRDSLMALVNAALKPLLHTHAAPDEVRTANQLHALITPAIAAIAAVIDDKSELCSIWHEDELLYPLWREDKLQLIARLQPHLGGD
jgi:Domain of unknown function (DUF4259)